MMPLLTELEFAFAAQLQRGRAYGADATSCGLYQLGGQV